ncbi:DUF4097 family beta strand repeat-containing protein [Kitasatospora brasiliensis]|uniref:DUF4097 family beta strand repeat-containing protein n=1 Tax=Kitasatospora brasiliensis TaxID=3058040 RepID=UPI00292E4D67|nr:DUF4097 family beta strand repeat-containing protein [Kitasatospora sp. K002]
MQPSRPNSRRTAVRYRRVVAPIVVTAALGVLLTACGGGKVTTESNSYQVSDAVTALRINSPGGLVEVVAGDGGGVRVTETARYDGDKPSVSHKTAADGVLVLDASECGHGIGHKVCQVGYRVVVPKGLATTVRNTGGDVTVTGLAGALDLASDGGKVLASGLASKSFTAKADGGTVNAAFVETPDRVRIESAGGSVTARLPDAAYAVDATANGGTADVKVKTDPASSHKVTIRSDGGSVSVLPAG